VGAAFNWQLLLLNTVLLVCIGSLRDRARQVDISLNVVESGAGRPESPSRFEFESITCDEYGITWKRYLKFRQTLASSTLNVEPPQS
jgi:hypothetical protein